MSKLRKGDILVRRPNPWCTCYEIIVNNDSLFGFNRADQFDSLFSFEDKDPNDFLPVTKCSKLLTNEKGTR